jgi:protein-arginine kinase activator protein McsA
LNFCPYTGKLCPNVKTVDAFDGQTPLNFKVCEECCKDTSHHLVDAQAELILGTIISLYGKESCPKCGLSLYTFNLEGKFGCDECYKHYRDEFLSIVEPLHHATGETIYHTGKRPGPFACGATFEKKLMYLKLCLAKAVELEEFDKAAYYRDEIDKLEEAEYNKPNEQRPIDQDPSM